VLSFEEIKMGRRRPRFSGGFRLRAGKSAFRVLFFIFIAVFVALRSRSRHKDPPARDDSSPVAARDVRDTGKYVAKGDEGLGAAVAIMIDNSGSMKERAGTDKRPKYEVARAALEDMLASTDSFAAKQPGFPIKVGLYYFASGVHTLAPIQAYDAAAVRAALDSMPRPNGGTAIGEAMDVARRSLYESGMIRKYILVVTDGENTDGRPPREVAQDIARRSEGAVRQYFVAFDVDAKNFAFLRDVHGEVLSAANGAALRASLDTIYRGKILAEAVDAGETLTPPTKKP
jgi:Mg-chelatase subunit ChlD